MRHPYFLRVAYLGTAFHGWQIQSVLPSVQRTLWDALRRVDPEVPMPQGTGRTDAGVHARAQGVLVMMQRPWDPYRLLAAANAHMPPTVRVTAVQPAPEGFWPRQHAVAKRYTYRLMEGPAADPLQHATRWHVQGAGCMDREAMAEAALHLVGEHDFTSFRHRDCVANSPIRTIHAVHVQGEGPFLDLVFEGNRFLMHQVRIMSGTLVEIGRGRRKPQDMTDILAARDRSRSGLTAPPEGLCLEAVWYHSQWGIGDPCPWGEPSLELPPAP